MKLFASILPTTEESEMILPGDDIIDSPNMVIDSAFSVDASPGEAFPWFVQLGKNRAGWYFPTWVERFMLPSKRGLRVIDEAWQGLGEGDRIPDYGGKNGYFDCVLFRRDTVICYYSQRGNLKMTWCLTFHDRSDTTRVIIRLRIHSDKRIPGMNTIGTLFDRLTILGLAAGVKERIKNSSLDK